jgi:predicted nucleotidyltransferase
MLSIRSDQPIDHPTLALLRDLDEVLSALAVPYFLAGALARDVLLTHVFGLPVYRATADVDLAVAVKDWSEFETTKAALEDKGVVRDATWIHRLFRNKYPIDLIPFGGVETPDKTIAWPPASSSVNVAGYREAFETAEEVEVEPGLMLRVVSLPALAALKIFAWGDRGHETSKDAQDLATLLRSYPDAGNEQRLYGEAIDAMEAVEYRIDLAGARLLGRDTRRMLTEDTHEQLFGSLDDPAQRERLAIAMSRVWGHTDDAMLQAERLLEQYQEGLAGK